MADKLYFQIDREYSHYLSAKAAACRDGGRPPLARWAVVEDSPEAARAHHAVLEWLDATAARECPEVFGSGSVACTSTASRYDHLLRKLQEDTVVIQRGSRGRDRAIGVHVSFPSGWRPERIARWSFRQIHGPVPGFAKTPAAAARMLRAMIDRGPYVRFVWTLSADDVLDHHPDEGGRVAWTAESQAGWLRVERQVTVPFSAVNAALFLIRTYLYPFASLDHDQRRDLGSALRAMPDPIRRYKGLAAALPHALAALERCAPGEGPG